MGSFIQLTADDGHGFDAYRAEPSTAATAGLVVIQEIFGVNGHIRGVCDGFAEEGYSVLSPALFDRHEKNIELSYTAEGIAEGREVRAKVGWDGPMRDIEACVAALADAAPGGGKIGAVGYCWGGSLAWLAACRLKVACAVGYYGGQISQYLDEQPACPVMLHFGSEDASIPLDDVAAIRKAHGDAAIHIYQGAGHGFSCDARADFDPDAAQRARARTLALFAQRLG